MERPGSRGPASHDRTTAECLRGFLGQRTAERRLTLASSSLAANRSFSTYSMAFTSWFVVRSTSFTAAASATLNRDAKPSNSAVAS